MSSQPRHSVQFREALEKLRAGNSRFSKNLRSVESLASQNRRDALVAGQSPFASVLSCSDSRVPSELVFDAGLGELFVVRIAGNIVAPSIVGSIEFAVTTFNTELVVVMGHTRCGAVAATVEALTSGRTTGSENVRDIVGRISPAVAEHVHRGPPDASMLRSCTRANVRASANHLRHGSRVLEQRINEGRLLIVGAEYALETGEVEFFDVPPH